MTSKKNGHNLPNKDAFPAIRETQVTPKLLRAQQDEGIVAKNHAYRMGKLSILITFEQDKGYHMSVGHPDRYPTWEECVHLRYTLLPDDITMAILLPPVEQFVSSHANVFHFWQVGLARRHDKEIL